MASESKGSLLAKSVSKHAGRAKEKFLQNLGKVDRTADDIFDEHLQNFTKQQNNASRLQKEFNNYIRCIRAVQAASKSLMDSLNEMYESGWLGHELLYTQSQNIEMLWNDFSHKLADQVLIPLNTYQAQFPEMRKKIEKRGRKLVDYDSQRHSAQSLQSSGNSAKKKDEIKALKVREQLEEAKRTYEVLNSELHDELPALYDSRVLFLVTNLQTYFAAEQIFHVETSKVFAELEAIVDRLATDSQRGSYSMKKLPAQKSILNHSGIKMNSPTSSHASVNDDDIPSIDEIASSVEPTISTNGTYKSINGENSDEKPESTSVFIGTNNNNSQSRQSSSSDSGEPAIVSVTDTTTIGSKTASSGNSTTTVTPNPANAIPPGMIKNTSVIDNNSKNVTNGVGRDRQSINKNQVEEIYDIPAGATTDNLPPGVLYKVKATYKYTQEDIDELSFDAGEIIRVVEYDDPEEQEEGWLMGIKEATGEKGMFPANFTKPL